MRRSLWKMGLIEAMLQRTVGEEDRMTETMMEGHLESLRMILWVVQKTFR